MKDSVVKEEKISTSEEIKDEKKNKDKKEEDKKVSKSEQKNKEVEKSKKTKKKRNSILIAIIIGIPVILGIVISTIFALLNIRNDKIVSGVSISGIEVSGLSKEEAKGKIEAMYQEKKEEEIDIKYEDFETTLNPTLLEVNYNIDKAIEDAYLVGRKDNIFFNNYDILYTLLCKKNINVDIPLGVFTCVTGVSGSGKSSLVNEILYKMLAKTLNRARCIPGKVKEIKGMDQLDKVINIDQSPIGRTPRSNPATYTGVFDMIRDLFAATPDAKARGYKKGRFSFNVKGGRCEACRGDGILKIEMNFLPDVYVPCEVCHGKRYNRETLDVLYKGKSIYDVLDMTVEEALDFFKNIPSIHRKIQTMYDVGLSYVKLGQPSTTLSGGEAQRIKLATELSKRSTGRTIYILDEPTTGLHFADVHKLIEILQRLTDGGNTVLVIEHNLDVIKTADYIIDIGPEGGEKGGTVIAKGTPEKVAKTEGSYTGEYIRKMLPQKGKKK